MQTDKKSKKYSIEKLRNILDNISSKDLPEEDKKYLISLRKRLDESSKDIVYRRPVTKDEVKEEVNPLKPKVTIHERYKEKIVEFSEVEEESKVKESAEVEFLPAEEKKEIKIEEEDIFEVVKKREEGPEFIKVKPKEVPKKEREDYLEFDESVEKEFAEWDAVEKTPDKKEVSDWEPADEDEFEIEIKETKPEVTEKKSLEEKIEKNVCVKCGAILSKDYKFCLQCGRGLDSEELKEENTDEHVKDEKSQEAKNEEAHENPEENTEFIPVKPVEIIKEKEEEIEEKIETERKPVEVAETSVKDEKSFEIEPSSVEKTTEFEIIKEQIKDEEAIESKALIEAFKDIESIDYNVAVLLYKNGYTSIDSLKDVTVKDLIKIKGIKRKTAKRIRREIDRKIVEDAQVRPIVPGETAEGEITEEQIEDEIVEEEDHSPKPVELSATSSEWEPATDEKIEESDLEIEKKVETFKDLESITAETAILLYNNGFTSIEELKNATLKDLIKIKGIKKNTAKRIIKEIEEKTEWNLLSDDEEEECFIEEESKKDEVIDVEEKIIEHEPESEDEFFEEEKIEDIPPIKIEKIETFKGVKSINVDIATLLLDNGIKSIDDLKKATIKDLTKIKGIRKKIAKQIRKEVNELHKDEPQESFERGENPFIQDKEDEWESFDEDKISDSKLEELKGFRHGDYTLHEKEIETKSGEKRIVRFFSKGEPEDSEPIDLPKGYEIKENKKTGVPYLKKKK